MQTDTSRELFEKWARERTYSLEAHPIKVYGDYKSEKTALAWASWQAALETRKVMQWQPIETAPRDGTAILLFGDNYGDRARGYHIITGYYNIGEDAWYDDPQWGELSKLEFITHWCELPSPPNPNDIKTGSGDGNK